MAIARLSMKVGKAGKAAPHAAYIARLGQYAARLGRGELLEATEAGNMPAWAQSDPLAFWQAADAYERKGGTTYREMEIALPRELLPEQRVALVRAFVHQEIGDRHAYQWAIHTPRAVDHGEQPHVHLMFSERQRDGIERDPEQYFKRYNAKASEKGGARKGYGPNAGQTLTRAERAAELKELRGRWESLCNAHLEQAGMAQRIDMRSHAERGTGLEPERKQLPSEWRGHGRANVIEFRQARAELAEASARLVRAVPDAGAEIINLEAERRRRAQEALEAGTRAGRERQETQPEPRRAPETGDREMAGASGRGAPSRADRERQERLRLERMSSRELAQEIARLRPPRVRDLVESDPAVVEAGRERRALEDRRWRAQTRENQSSHEAEQWRQAHPVRARAHDAGVFRAAFLDEQARIEAEARQEAQQLGPRIDEADKRQRMVRSEAERRITAEQAPMQAKVAELEALQREKAGQELAEKKRQEVIQRFERMAERRLMGAPGYQDSSRDWRATPKPLRDLIDEYNRQPKAVQAEILRGLRDDAEAHQQLARLLQQRTRSLDRGGQSL